MGANMHDVVRRLQPGHVVSWTEGSGRFTYVGYVATNGLVYTTATEQNRFIPQTMTLSELANLLDNEGSSLFLATNWEVQDVIASSVPPPPALVPRQIITSNPRWQDSELLERLKKDMHRSPFIPKEGT